MAPRRYLALHRLDAPDKQGALRRLAQASHDVGVRPVETFFDPSGTAAYTLFQAPDEHSIRDAYVRAELPPPRIMPTERVFTELLDRPHRSRGE